MNVEWTTATNSSGSSSSGSGNNSGNPPHQRLQRQQDQQQHRHHRHQGQPSSRHYSRTTMIFTGQSQRHPKDHRINSNNSATRLRNNSQRPLDLDEFFDQKQYRSQHILNSRIENSLPEIRHPPQVIFNGPLAKSTPFSSSSSFSASTSSIAPTSASTSSSNPRSFQKRSGQADRYRTRMYHLPQGTGKPEGIWNAFQPSYTTKDWADWTLATSKAKTNIVELPALNQNSIETGRGGPRPLPAEQSPTSDKVQPMAAASTPSTATSSQQNNPVKNDQKTKTVTSSSRPSSASSNSTMDSTQSETDIFVEDLLGLNSGPVTTHSTQDSVSKTPVPKTLEDLLDLNLDFTTQHPPEQGASNSDIAGALTSHHNDGGGETVKGQKQETYGEAILIDFSAPDPLPVQLGNQNSIMTCLLDAVGDIRLETTTASTFALDLDQTSNPTEINANLYSGTSKVAADVKSHCGTPNGIEQIEDNEMFWGGVSAYSNTSSNIDSSSDSDSESDSDSDLDDQGQDQDPWEDLEGGGILVRLENLDSMKEWLDQANFTWEGIRALLFKK